MHEKLGKLIIFSLGNFCNKNLTELLKIAYEIILTSLFVI